MQYQYKIEIDPIPKELENLKRLKKILVFKRITKKEQ